MTFALCSKETSSVTYNLLFHFIIQIFIKCNFLSEIQNTNEGLSDI